MNIGILAGAFNPIRFAHTELARSAIDELELDSLIVVPIAGGAFRKQEESFSFPNRIKMVENAFSCFEKAVVDVRWFEMDLRYAVRGIIGERSQADAVKVFLIVGEDSAEDLRAWQMANPDISITLKVFKRIEEPDVDVAALFKARGVVFNDDARLVEVVQAGLERKNGFCPCRLAKTPENFCPCDEFKMQLQDSTFHGLCHCRYYKRSNE